MTRRAMLGWLASAGALRAQSNAPEPGAFSANPALMAVEDVEGLPRVLLIGDSISIGYTLFVRQMLQGKANVHRIPTNGGPTPKGVENIDAWLGKGRWDVIHFNWGLHDLKYMFDDRPQVELAQYEKNLERLVVRLGKTGARLIWAATTPVPSLKVSPKRIPGDVVRYNEAAARVMKRHGVAVNDLHALANARLSEIQIPNNVHFTPDGSRALAGQVAEAILTALSE
ncbi:MAG: SGNH/GDSL hydrolase family protein [Bryobacterales bacterium]|nr:SGNH/GDSL hydrolase family protein [Bryobacterales bacterium]